MDVCMYVCTYVCMYVCVHIYIHIYMKFGAPTGPQHVVLTDVRAHNRCCLHAWSPKELWQRYLCYLLVCAFVLSHIGVCAVVSPTFSVNPVFWNSQIVVSFSTSQHT